MTFRPISSHQQPPSLRIIHNLLKKFAKDVYGLDPFLLLEQEEQEDDHEMMEMQVLRLPPDDQGALFSFVFAGSLFVNIVKQFSTETYVSNTRRVTRRIDFCALMKWFQCSMLTRYFLLRSYIIVLRIVLTFTGSFSMQHGSFELSDSQTRVLHNE